MKVLNDLLGFKDLKIVQNTKYFSFSLDSILLANFVSIKKDVKKVLDIGTGNAPIPMVLSLKTNADIYAFEIQEEIYNMAKESIDINNLSKRITLFNADIKKIGDYFGAEYFDVIVSNPPYFKVHDKSKMNTEEIKAIARHEIALDLKSLLLISSKYLKNNGVFAMVYRTERLTEVLSLMSNYKLEPKRILFIYPKEKSQSNLFLVEGIKNGNSGIKKVEYLIIHEDNGEYSEEVKKYFC